MLLDTGLAGLGGRRAAGDEPLFRKIVPRRSSSTIEFQKHLTVARSRRRHIELEVVIDSMPFVECLLR